MKTHGVRVRIAILGVLVLSAACRPRAAAPPATHAHELAAGDSLRHVEFDGTLERGSPFERDIALGLRFELLPEDYGWRIVVRDTSRADENLASLTPPFHFVPNPCFIEGWHFRNADNTGPNQGDVNAPQRERDFIFSPEVGRTIQGPDSHSGPDSADVARVEQFGSGLLTIEQLDLSPPAKGEKASIERMRFRVSIRMRAGAITPQ